MHDRMLNQLDNNAIKVSVHRLRYLPHQFPMVRGFIKKKERGNYLPTLSKWYPLRPVPDAQVIAPRSIEYITRLYLQKMRETCHLLQSPGKI
ncbi:hypothetical protein F3B51_15015 [Bacteroides ovatus]|uniref:Uncharacterized protein n=1 Tax=Bacteroides ovatus TaxID=28116 RepID=A0A5N4EUI6_BACOV|nr:hypothetical protein F3B68_11670 [Bacteroides ovatus]KAB6093254.1 hypothetical protein GA551_07435 [Bacteroides xylanisolvens]KAA4565711.1 hypothetical protein F3C56_11605 [Bacteroides ovatus]KAA4570166.1 hypothetical protein F3B65_13570 [Bacteroides ovatus]KAA4578753.1 hypothetical protein F3B64_12850 [Bacteroides ovatus]